MSTKFISLSSVLIVEKFLSWELHYSTDLGDVLIIITVHWSLLTLDCCSPGANWRAY